MSTAIAIIAFTLAALNLYGLLVLSGDDLGLALVFCLGFATTFTGGIQAATNRPITQAAEVHGQEVEA